MFSPFYVLCLLLVFGSLAPLSVLACFAVVMLIADFSPRRER